MNQIWFSSRFECPEHEYQLEISLFQAKDPEVR